MDPEIAAIAYNSSRIYFHVPNELTLWRVGTFWEKEPDTLRWIDTFKPDDLFIDIGANMGIYSLYAAFSRGVDVIAFEPEALNYALLNKNIYLNQIHGKIKAYPIALSDKTSLNTLHLSQFIEGGSCHQFKEKILPPKFHQGCFAMALDELIEQGLIPVPQHIKIDVDGNEPQIIQGALKTLCLPEVRSVLVELNLDLPGHTQVIDLMKEKGFIYCMEGPLQKIKNHIFFREPKSEWERLFSLAKFFES